MLSRKKKLVWLRRGIDAKNISLSSFSEMATWRLGHAELEPHSPRHFHLARTAYLLCSRCKSESSLQLTVFLDSGTTSLRSKRITTALDYHDEKKCLGGYGYATRGRQHSQ
ncbi:hypothetical protein BDZ97DRAFT_901635 [Flammula alnicola]|nr:hypothetical protein BDZ97DRAFT_901635 [Flammula alnicola]